MARKIEVEIVGDVSGLKRSLGDAEKHTTSFGSRLGGLAKTAGLAAGAAGIGALVGTLKVGIDEYSESTKVAAQTNAVIRSTGKEAGVTAKHVGDLANSIMKKSGLDDEAVQSGENLLLTFTNIRNEAGRGNDIFDQTTNIMADMSVALGQDTSSSALQLGKALNDPIKGVTALQRVGVSFTQGQRDTIKSMVDAGHTMDAQKLILHELTKEFGGSAAAAGKTLPGQLNIAKQTFSNFAGELVARMIPVMQRTIGYLRDHWPEIRAAIQNFASAVKPIFVAIGDVVQAVVQGIRHHWNTIGPIVHDAAAQIKSAAKVISGALHLVIDLLHGDWGAAWKDMKQVASGAFDIVKSGAHALGTALKGAFAGIGGTIAGLLKAPANAAIGVWNRLRIPGFHVHINVPLAPDIDFGWGGYDFPDIPTLARGGIVTKPTLALIGEAGKEAVVPLPDRGGMLGGHTFHFHFDGPVFGDKRQVARELADAMRLELVRIGQREPTIFSRPGVVA